MKILVTGSQGTLGRPLVMALRAAGHDVHGCDLKHTHEPQEHRVDIGQYRQVERVLGLVHPDLVFHLAAEFGRNNGEHYYEQLWQSNVIGTRHLLEIQKYMGFRMIFASSSEVYGDGIEEPLYEELTDELPLRHLNDYAVTKWVNEVQIRNFIERHANEVMTLRFFNAYGPGEYYHSYRSVICLFVYRALMGMPYTVYQGYHRVFMYIGDFIPTLVKAVERFQSGATVNIGGDEYRSVKEASDLILEAVGRDDSLVMYLPEEEHNVVNKMPVITKAESLLGHENRVTLEKGIPLTVEWMRKEYGL